MLIVRVLDGVNYPSSSAAICLSVCQDADYPLAGGGEHREMDQFSVDDI